MKVYTKPESGSLKLAAGPADLAGFAGTVVVAGDLGTENGARWTLALGAVVLRGGQVRRLG